MESQTKRKLTVEPIGSQEPEIGRWLWALEDVRRHTLEELAGVAAAAIDWLPANGESSIGTILYHIADIEADWLYVEVLEQSFPREVAELFPYATRDEQGHLTQVQGWTLAEHLSRLETVRSLLLSAFGTMSLADFRRARSLDEYDVTPEWVLYHLIEHEAEHHSQLGALRGRAEQHLAGE